MGNKSKAAKSAKKAMTNEMKSVMKETAKEVRKEVKAVVTQATGQQMTKAIVQAAKQAPNVHKQKAAKQFKKDPVFARYLSLLVNPDTSEPSGVPDGFPVPTALTKSTQTIDVIGNYNATSIAAGNGGRFAFHIAPNIGHGITENDGYIQTSNSYLNMLGGVTDTEDAFQFILGCKVASIRPSVVWAPGYVYTSLDDEKSKLGKKGSKKRESKEIDKISDIDTNTVDDDSIIAEAKRLALLKNGRSKKSTHRLMSDYNNSAYEYWKDLLSDEIGGVYAPIGGLGDVNGIATLIRPVAMSVWFQCAKPELDNGGMVSACLLPSGTTTGQIIPLDWAAGAAANDFTGYGPLQNWENLAEVPGNYNGKLKDGTYTFWVPQRVQDLDMTSPAMSDLYDFPTIMVAGQWAPNAGETVSAASSLLGRLRICTVYEYCSQSQIASLAYRGCSPCCLDRVKILLHGQSTSMANGDHMAWIKKILSSAAGAVSGFALGGPAGAFEGAVGGWALGKKWAGE